MSKTVTRNLIEAWNERPKRFGPFEDTISTDNAVQLEWASTKLLPALKEAIPFLESLYPSEATLPTPPKGPDDEIPSTQLQPEQEQLSSIRNQEDSPSTGGTAEAVDRGGGIFGTPEVLTTMPAAMALRQAIEKHGRPAKAKKPSSALRKARRKTVASVTT